MKQEYIIKFEKEIYNHSSNGKIYKLLGFTKDGLVGFNMVDGEFVYDPDEDFSDFVISHSYKKTSCVGMERLLFENREAKARDYFWSKVKDFENTIENIAACEQEEKIYEFINVIKNKSINKKKVLELSYILFTKDGSVDYDNISKLEKLVPGLSINPGERDDDGWITGIVSYNGKQLAVIE